MSPSQALTKRSSDLSLMPPPPPPKRQKRPPKVLDEDVYSDALSHIVARDFFPGLLETEAQQDYLSALDSQNADWIRESGRRLTSIMTPGPEGRRRAGRGTSFTPRRSTTMLGETPRNFKGETPVRTPRTVMNDDFAPEQRPDVDVNMSLSAFQAKYTSEDNESFNALLDKQNEKRAAKYAFFQHGNKILAPRQIAHRERQQKLLQNGESSSTEMITTNAAGEERRVISGPAEGPSQDLDARPASVDSFPNREGPRNHFMFDPEGIEDTPLTTHAQHSATKSNAAPKTVQYTATRFPPTAAPTSSIPPSSPSLTAIIDAAISRHPPRPTDSEPGYSGASTPRVNGYAFVDAEPTPSELGLPVTDEEADTAERESAKQFLPKVEAGGPNPFTINERSQREKVLERLVEKADKGRRKGGRMEGLRELGITGGGGRTKTPRFSSAPGGLGGGPGRGGVGMTPAGRRLAASIGTPRREGEGFGVEGKGGWTPMSRVKREMG